MDAKISRPFANHRWVIGVMSALSVGPVRAQVQPPSSVGEPRDVDVKAPAVADDKAVQGDSKAGVEVRRRFRLPVLRNAQVPTLVAPKPAEKPEGRPLAPSHGPQRARPEETPSAVPSAPAADPKRGDSNVGYDGLATAGYHDGVYYLRDKSDLNRLFVGGRLHLDGKAYAGAGVAHSDLVPTLGLRRVRLILGGEMTRLWQWEVELEAAPGAYQNPTGTEQLQAAPPGETPSAYSARYKPAQQPGYRMFPLHAFINLRAADWLNVQLGQVEVPFTMENRTSTQQIPFMERSLAVRVWGMPMEYDLGATLWGELSDGRFGYQAMLAQGDGPNRLNADGRGMLAARFYARPFLQKDTVLSQAQFGISGRYSSIDKNKVTADVPSLSTHAGHVFWTPSYVDSVGTGRVVHVIGAGDQVGLAAEAWLPLDAFDLRSEVVYLSHGTREAVEGYQRGYSERFGRLTGYSYYVTAGYWIMGQSGLAGRPGDQQPRRLQLDNPESSFPPHATQVLVRWEQLRGTYASSARAGVQDPMNMDGDIRVDAVSAGLNYWANRHLRISLNYVLNRFPGATSRDRWTATQRAQAPGNTIAPGLDDDARTSAQYLHEFMVRVGLSI